ncbi:NAD(P)-binding protein [Polychaeton citri CBS 116435]|uniref:NAD(P)-binding protein n=1 Tax=Polychaeton citri CBS 116435 TaxID=1314669 RepID=A0A9P4UML7_9PEZI|nr:NAD(P)-binding protein [Polychaeton citri CBS 116435]
MAQNKKLLVVVGATGTQGSAIISYFLDHDISYEIRGLTRNISSTKSLELSSRGVEMVQADLQDVQSLKVAFKGANAIFAYTDFAGCTQTKEAKDAVALGKARSLPEAAGEVEFMQSRNIADAAIGIGPRLERLVWSTCVDPVRVSAGKFPIVHEMQYKDKILHYMRSQPGLEGKVSSIAFSVFADSLVRFPQVYGWVKTESHARATYKFKVPVASEARMEWIDMQSDAGSWTKALLTAPTEMDVAAIGESLSFNEIAAIISKKFGVEVTVETLSEEDYAKTDDTAVLRDIALLLRWVAEYGITGDDPMVLKHDQLEKRGFDVKRSSVKSCIEDMDWSSLL